MDSFGLFTAASFDIPSQLCLFFIAMGTARLSQLIRATDEDGSALSSKEIVDNVFTLVFAGIETCLHRVSGHPSPNHRLDGI